MNFRILSWNLYHGRDFPPPLRADGSDPDGGEAGVAAGGPGWRLLGRPVRGRRHVRLNRDLFREFAAFLAAAKWDVALLQEVPPRWRRRLADATGAEARSSLTSRNWMRPLTSVPARLRPHLTGSWEGGSNLILVRGAARGLDSSRPGAAITAFHTTTLTRWPERRRVSMVELDCGLCLANLHASTGARAADDVLRAARFASDHAGERPLVLGGDFNLRPRSGGPFDRLATEFGLSGPTAPAAIDHLLVRKVEVLEPAEPWTPTRRDVPDPGTGLQVRLSDHAPVAIRIRI